MDWKVYIVIGGVIHNGCVDDWSNMDETGPVPIAFLEKASAIKYIEDLFPGMKVENDELSHEVTWDDYHGEDKEKFAYTFPGDDIYYHIEEFSVQ